MKTYTYKFQDKKRIITELDLMDLNVRLDLKRVQNTQNRGSAVVFCNCNSIGIPMKFSDHYPKPHFYNASERLAYKHFKYCPHRLLDKSEQNYSPSVVLDDEGNKKFKLQKDRKHRIVEDYLGDDLKIRNDDYRFVYNNREDEIQEGRMNFSSFVRYANLEYFVINQYTNKAKDIASFNRALYGYAMAQKVNAATLDKFLGGSFYYKVLDGYKVNKRFTTLINEDGKNWFVPNTFFDKALKKFKQQYGDVELANTDDYKIVIFGSKGKKKIDDGRIITDIFSIEFLVVTKDGLAVDCMSQVPIFNYLYEKAKENEFIFERPTEPRDYYRYYPNLVCDGLLRNKEKGIKALIEVFEKKGEKFDKIKEVKEKYCRGHLISYDPNQDDIQDVFKAIDEVFKASENLSKEIENVSESKPQEEKKDEGKDFVFKL